MSVGLSQTQIIKPIQVSALVTGNTHRRELGYAKCQSGTISSCAHRIPTGHTRHKTLTVTSASSGVIWVWPPFTEFLFCPVLDPFQKGGTVNSFQEQTASFCNPSLTSLCLQSFSCPDFLLADWWKRLGQFSQNPGSQTLWHSSSFLDTFTLSLYPTRDSSPQDPFHLWLHLTSSFVCIYDCIWLLPLCAWEAGRSQRKFYTCNVNTINQGPGSI